MVFGRYRGDEPTESPAIPAPSQVVLPVGIPSPDLLVREGDSVCAGQPLVPPSRILPRHFHLASVSGTVAAFIPHGKGMRAPVSVVLNRSPGDEHCGERFAMPSDPEAARQVLVRSGAVHGCPPDAARWLLQPRAAPVTALLVACFASGPLEPRRLRLAACESSHLREGLALWRSAVGGSPVVLMVAEDEAAAWRAMGAGPGETTVHPCPRRYPAEHPQMLASRHLRHDLPGGSLPLDRGLLVIDLLAVCAAGQVAATGEALRETTVDLVGQGAVRPVTLRARIGTRAADLFKRFVVDPPPLFVGGGLLAGERLGPESPVLPHQGTIVALRAPTRRFLSFMSPAVRRPSWTRAALSSFLPPRSLEARAEVGGELRPCISCGACEEVCPRGISPSHLARLAEGGFVEEMIQYGIDRCIECGLCSYVCPSKIELMAALRRGIEAVAREQVA
jgi:Na+-translocating ferredoxin:NAD+ oxidoreductase RnfC subunit